MMIAPALALSLLSFAPQASTPMQEEAPIGPGPRQLVESFQAALGFPSEGRAGWPRIEASLHEHGIFVPDDSSTPGVRPRGRTEFLAEMRDFLDSSVQRRLGIEQHVLTNSLGRYSAVAWAQVEYTLNHREGDGPLRYRGVHSMQLVQVRGEWKILSLCAETVPTERPLPPAARVTGPGAADGDAPDSRPHPLDDDLRGVLRDFYAALSFEKGAECDWDGLRATFAKGAVLSTGGGPKSAPRVQLATDFIRGFAGFVDSAKLRETGFVEQPLAMRTWIEGRLAQAQVTFEARRPGEDQVMVRGIDCWQFVRIDGKWRCVALASADELPAYPLPRLDAGR